MASIGLLEDNTRIAKLCATMLQYAGHQAIVYTHPRHCLDALLVSPESASVSAPSSKFDVHISPSLPVDILILDLHLPDITGLDVLRSLREHPRTHALPLIFCTAASASEIALALRLAPQARFIEKPFTFQQLIAAISYSLSL